MYTINLVLQIFFLLFCVFQNSETSGLFLAITDQICYISGVCKVLKRKELSDLDCKMRWTDLLTFDYAGEMYCLKNVHPEFYI